jgi:hypothetical protein
MTPTVTDTQLTALTAAHLSATEAAANALRARLDQHTAQRGEEPPMPVHLHLLHLTSAAGQVAAAARQLDAWSPEDATTLDELRGEVLYLATTVLSFLEELNRRRRPAEPDDSAEGAWAYLRREAVARRLLLEPTEHNAAVSAGESIGQEAIAAAVRRRFQESLVRRRFQESLEDGPAAA